MGQSRKTGHDILRRRNPRGSVAPEKTAASGAPRGKLQGWVAARPGTFLLRSAEMVRGDQVHARRAWRRSPAFGDAGCRHASFPVTGSRMRLRALVAAVEEKLNMFRMDPALLSND